MVLDRTQGRVLVTASRSAISIDIKSSRSLFLTIMLTAWSLILTACAIFMILTLVRRGSFYVLVGPLLFIAAMLAYAILLIRWNIKGNEHLEVSEKEVLFTRTCHPAGNLEKRYDNIRANFILWRPYQRGTGQFDFDVWRMGAWSLAILNASGKRVKLVNRLTREDARLTGEALRSAGYKVQTIEDGV